MDVVTDRLLRHMQWANAYVFQKMSECSPEELKLCAPNDDWSTVQILEHLTASRLAHMLDGLGEVETSVPTSSEEVIALGELSAKFVARLRESAKEPVGFIESIRNNRKTLRSRETFLAQAIHHATEHRAQIAGIFALHGLKIIDLDAIALWQFEDYENLGDQH